MIQNHGNSRLLRMTNVCHEYCKCSKRFQEATAELQPTLDHLFGAIESGHTSIVSLLLENGAKINAHDELVCLHFHFVQSIAHNLFSSGIHPCILQLPKVTRKLFPCCWRRVLKLMDMIMCVHT